jgi:hypothetical protein
VPARCMAARADTGVPLLIERVRACVPLIEGVGDCRLGVFGFMVGSVEGRRPLLMAPGTGFLGVEDIVIRINNDAGI